MSEVIELDNTKNMSPEQALARADRCGFKRIVILGIAEDGEATYIFSDTTNYEAHWTICRAALHILSDGIAA